MKQTDTLNGEVDNVLVEQYLILLLKMKDFEFNLDI